MVQVGVYSLSALALLGIGGSTACQLTPTRFRTNNLQNPLAIAGGTPVFSWALAFAESGGSEPPRNELGVDHHQTAYRLTCYNRNRDNESVLWDSGKLPSRETLQIEYNGQPLQSLQRVRWHVQVWDENDQECPSTEEDPWFETGLLGEDSWGKSEWIARYGPLPPSTGLCEMMAENDENQVPRFRASLSDIPKSIVQARAYISGLGYYHLHINGEKVGDSLLDPGWTTYSKRVLYSAYDVTSLLQLDGSNHYEQEHVVGVELGNGWWNPIPLLFFGQGINLRKSIVMHQRISSSRPMFRLRIVGFQADGTTVQLLDSKSGQSSPWLASGSPTTFNNIYLGEKYNALFEDLYRGWTTTNYTVVSSGEEVSTQQSTAKWQAVVKANVSGLGRLEAMELPPIRKQKWLPSTLVSTNLLQSGETVGIIDTGVNHAGSCQISVKEQGPEAFGTTIKLRYGELLTHDGSLNVYTSAAGGIKKQRNPKVPCQPDVAYQGDTLTLGAQAVQWTPSWSWHGFRYIEVTTPSSVRLEDVSIRCFTMRTDVDLVANFSSSDPWLSDLRQVVKNTYESNMMSLQSDCPHRERLGYGGDALGCGEVGLSIYDFSAFYRKRVLDYNDAQAQTPSGALDGFTETSPYVGIHDNGLGHQTGPIGWQAFQPEALLWLYKYYGDTRTLKESYNHTLAYIKLLDTSDQKLIEDGLGDWLAVDETDVAFTGRGFQFMSYLAFANITEILGMSPSVAKKYRQKAAELVHNINSRFLDGTGAYKVSKGQPLNRTTTQTGQSMALFHGFLSDDNSLRSKALHQLMTSARKASHLKGACRYRGQSKKPPGCQSAHGGPGPHITGGLFGVKWILMALADGGENDLAYDMVTTRSYPGIRWMTNNPFSNATTVWETFHFSEDSHNHPMFSSTEVWLLQTVAGIQPHPSARGMDHVLIKPNPPSQLHHASASFESPRGVTRVSWKRQLSHSGKPLGLNVTIPPNCKATVYIPAERSMSIKHNGIVLSNVSWVPHVLREDRGSFVVEIGSGRHIFQAMEGNQRAVELQ
ncbi:Alpha-L-rhamnosidase [Seminavis robusta]|uniref:alpha-L-rhamnosidase n=1 Tax=Seminavis robusta TaxID=568900 RepID=A0A9N8HLL8_9STRA|nr:Alpha-L-rhamnosidase [Seminavis robusta]|eukprot:Sro831_g208380.1 Alpha-L-rhamnosidase (1041) ;mRNA; r:33871-36993